MASQLIIEIDSLTREKAQVYAGIILAIGGFEDGETADIGIDPLKAFGPASQTGTVDTKAPHISIGDTLSGTDVPAGLTVVSQFPPPPPIANTMPATLGVSTAETIVDSTKLPWDGRIHASSKAMNADGTWRFKRGIDKTLIDSVTAELRRAMSVPGPQLVQATSPLPPPPPPPAPSVSTVTAPPPPPPPPATQEVNPRDAYVALVGRAAAAVGAGKVSHVQINQCLGAIGIDNMPALGHRLDLVPTAANLIDGIIAGQSA